MTKIGWPKEAYDAVQGKIPPIQIFGGPPPAELATLGTKMIAWRCECGGSGISSSIEWAQSDVNRHRNQTGCLRKESE